MSGAVTRKEFDELYREYENLISENSDIECLDYENIIGYRWSTQIIRGEHARSLVMQGHLKEAIEKMKTVVDIMRTIANEYNGVELSR